MTEGEKVTLVGFGTFHVVERKAGRAWNLQAERAIQEAAKISEVHSREGFEGKDEEDEVLNG